MLLVLSIVVDFVSKCLCGSINAINYFQCKEWGFLLLEMFGTSLGMGDYGHLTIQHVPMLFRANRSLHHLLNQGFEAAHKLQRQFYARATSHDSSGSTTSCKLEISIMARVDENLMPGF